MDEKTAVATRSVEAVIRFHPKNTRSAHLVKVLRFLGFVFSASIIYSIYVSKISSSNACRPYFRVCVSFTWKIYENL